MYSETGTRVLQRAMGIVTWMFGLVQCSRPLGTVLRSSNSRVNSCS